MSSTWSLFRELADKCFQFLNSPISAFASLSRLELLGLHDKPIQGHCQLISEVEAGCNLLDGPA